MENINTIRETLNNNLKINDFAKQAILTIINDMAKQGYLSDYTQINSKLLNLEIVEGKLTNKAIVYQDGKIIIDPNQVKYYDHTLALTSVIIEMFRRNSDTGQLTEPISLGFNESYALSLVGIDGRARYEEEQVFSRMLGKMIDDSVLADIYFNGNMLVDLPKALLKIGCSEEDITELLQLIQKNYQSKDIK